MRDTAIAACLTLAALGSTPVGCAAGPAMTRASGSPPTSEQIAAGNPTLVSLHVKNANARDVLLAISRQAKTPIRLRPEDLWTEGCGIPPKVTVAVDGQPFWTVVADVCQQAKLLPSAGELEGGLTLTQDYGQPMSAHAFAGPRGGGGRFTFVATGYEHDRRIAFADGSILGGDTVSVTVLVDPAVQVMAGEPVQVRLVRATDDRGHSLLGDRSPSEPYGVRTEHVGPVLLASFGLQPPSAGATKLAVVRGTLTATLVTRSERVAFDDLSHAGRATRSAGGYTFDLDKATVGERDVSYQVAVRSTPQADHQPPRMPAPLLAARLVDVNGDTIDGDGGSNADVYSKGQVVMIRSVRSTAPIRGPVQLVWDVPTGSQPISVPIEFHDLPLPPR